MNTVAKTCHVTFHPRLTFGITAGRLFAKTCQKYRRFSEVLGEVLGTDLVKLRWESGGELGIRTPDTLLGYTRLAGEHLRPLGQLSTFADKLK